MQAHGPLHLEHLFLHDVTLAMLVFILLLVQPCVPIAMQVLGQLLLALR